jgi:hypothetical protein
VDSEEVRKMSFTLPTDPYLPNRDLLTAEQFKTAWIIQALIFTQALFVSLLSYLVGNFVIGIYGAIPMTVIFGLSYFSFGRLYLIRFFTTAHHVAPMKQLIGMFYGWTSLLVIAGQLLVVLIKDALRVEIPVYFILGAVCLVVCSLLSMVMSIVNGPEISKTQSDAILSKVTEIAQEKANIIEQRLRTIVPVESDETRAHPVMRLPVVPLKTDEDKQIAKSMLRVALGIDDRLI